MLTTAKATQEFLDALREYDQQFCKGFLAQFDRVQLGFQRPPDIVFKVWFEQRCMENPNWLLAGIATHNIEGTDTFADDVRRYMKVSGVTGEGVTWQDFARSLAVKYAIEKAAAAPPEGQVPM